MIAPARTPERTPPPHAIERHPQDGWTLAQPAPLSRASERALRGVIRALLPPAPAPRPDGIEARIERQVRAMMQYMTPSLRLGFVLLVHLMEWAPLWRLTSVSRLSNLPSARASRVLAGLAQSRLLPLRLMMLAPKALVLSAYFDQDEVHAVLDYEPRGFIRERIARRAELMEREALDGRSSAREQQEPGTFKRNVRRMEVVP